MKQPEEPRDATPLPIDGDLDLHPFPPEQTRDLVNDYLDECVRAGIRHVRIAHGKGIGARRNQVHAILEARSDVSSFRLAGHERGGWGATLVELDLSQPASD